MILENNRDDENVGRHRERHHENIEDDQQVISFALKLGEEVANYILGIYVWEYHLIVVRRAIKFQPGGCWYHHSRVRVVHVSLFYYFLAFYNPSNSFI